MKPRPDVVPVDQPWKREYRQRFDDSGPLDELQGRRADCLEDHWSYVHDSEDGRYLRCGQCGLAFYVGDLTE